MVVVAQDGCAGGHSRQLCSGRGSADADVLGKGEGEGCIRFAPLLKQSIFLIHQEFALGSRDQTLETKLLLAPV